MPIGDRTGPARGALSAMLLVCAAAQAQPELTRPEAIVARASELVAGAETAYVSEYISFAGADASGRVAFALDTNRGRADGEHQAEHFVAMHDEQAGWIDVEGGTDIGNAAGRLLGWPESAYFEIEGEPYAIDVLRSRPNGLRLEIGALRPRVTEAGATRLFSLASAPATLVRGERTIRGRVIYEYLAMRGENRLAAGLGGALAILTGGPDFQGLYLSGADADADVYVHDALVSAAGSTGNALMGFWTRDGSSQRMEGLELEVTDFDAALGLYRWPSAWRATWQSECGEAVLSVESLEHATQSNWITGGFAMRTAEATLSCGGETATLHGFAELIR